MARNTFPASAVEASQVTGGALAVTPEVAPQGPQTRHVTSAPLFFDAPTYVAPDRSPAQTEQQASPVSARWEGYSNFDWWKDFAAQETVLGSGLIALHEAGMTPDPNYSTDVNSKEFKALVQDIDPEQYHTVAQASSAEQARAIVFRLKEEKERSNRLMEAGFLPFMAANIINPESLLLAMASGGLSWAQKGTRLARVGKQAGLAAAENMAQEAALNALQDNRDVADIAIAGAAGVILGGAFGAFSKGLPEDVRPRLADAAHRDFDKVVELQAADMGIVQPKPYSIKRAEAEAEGKLIDSQIDEAIEAEVSKLRAIVEGPEGLAVRIRNDFAETEARLRRAKGTRDEIANELMDDEGKQIGREAERLARADRKNEYAIKRAQTTGKGAGEIFAKWTDAATTNVKAARGRAKGQLTDAQKVVDALQLDVDRAVRVQSAESQLSALLNGRKLAKDTKGRAELMPEGRIRDRITRRIDEQQTALKEASNEEAADLSKAAQPAAPAASPVTPGFGADSASGARLDVGVEEARFAEPEVDTAATARPTIFGIKVPRFDYTSILRSPTLPAPIREIVSRYVGDSVPEKGKVSLIGASEKAAQLRDRYTTRFSQVYEKEFERWADATNRFSGSRRARREFGRGVTRALRINGDHPEFFTKSAARLRELFAEIGSEAKAAGVRGFEEFTADAHYFPRVPDRPKVIKSQDKYTSEGITSLIDSSIMKAYKDLGIEFDPKVSRRIAEGYWSRLLDLSSGVEQEALSGLRLTDEVQIRALMKFAGASDDVVEETAGRLRLALAAQGKEGSARYAKSRTVLDEDLEHTIFNTETGQMETKSLRDLLFHDDAQQVFDTYNHTMSGWSALARYADIKHSSQHADLVKKVRLDIPGKEGTRVAEALDDAYKFIVGQPLFDTKRWTTTRRIGRALRDYQFARVMNMVGFAQVPDAAAYLTPKYLRHTARHFPEIFSIFNRMKNGQLENKVARDLEEYMGGATDGLHNKLFSAYDDEPDAPISKAEHALRYAGAYTQGRTGGKLRNWFGVTPMTDFNQRLGELAVTSRFMDNLTGRLKDMSDDDWAKLGITAENLEKIRLEANSKVQFDGNKLRDMDLASWEPAARERFVMAAHRETRRLQQEEDFGDTNPLMHSAMGKIALQFRRYGVVSYTKQLVRGIADRDAEVLSRLVVQVHMGGLAYSTQMYLYSLTKPEEERQEWRDKYINWRTFYLGGIARAGMFSLTPALIESLYQLATGDQSTFNKTRTTGLAGNLIAGIPVIDFANNAARAIGGISETIVRGDRQYDQKDFAALRKTMLFSNMIVVKQFMDMIQNELPERDEDADPDTAQWRFLSSP